VEQWGHPGGGQKFTGVMVGGEQNLLLGMRMDGSLLGNQLSL